MQDAECINVSKSLGYFSPYLFLHLKNVIDRKERKKKREKEFMIYCKLSQHM